MQVTMDTTDTSPTESDENTLHMSGRKRNRTESGTSTLESNQTSIPSDSNQRMGTDDIPIRSLCSIVCCELLCLAVLAIQEMTLARTTFQTMTQPEQRQWVLDYISSHYSVTDGKYLFTVGTQTVCLAAWRLILGLSKSRFYRIRQLFQDGCKIISPRGLTRRGTHSSTTHSTIAWIQQYTNTYAENLPNTSKHHLPSCLTRKDVYMMCKSELEDSGVLPCSKAHFYMLWRTKFAHVTIPKINRFAKCDKCTFIKIKLQSTRNKNTRDALFEKRNRHLKQQSVERQKYYKHANKARKQPDKYMSLIIDGMDQSKTYLPHFVETSKHIQSIWKLKVHVTGILAHGLGAYGFFDTCQWPHSGNFTLNIMLEIFNMYRQNLPEILYLQMDNCGRENKNRFVFAFCCYLVELRVFKKIKISFLMVGHTHEDVDQMFSRFSRYLDKHEAATLEKMVSCLEQSYTPQPTGVVIDKLYNISAWLDPYIDQIAFHSKPHVFRITLDANNRAKILTKKWSSDKTWQVCVGSGQGHLLRDRPPGRPDLLPPDFSGIDMARLKPDVQSVYRYMKTTGDRQWWETWFREVEDEDEHEDDVDGWLLPQVHETCLAARETRYAHMDQNDLMETLDDLSDEESSIRQVMIGRKEKRAVTSTITKPMEVGDLCLLDMPRYADTWPQVAQITAINDNKVSVDWYKGSMMSKFTPWILQKKGQGRVRWSEEVHPNLIWHYGFQLTAKGFLPAHIRKLLERYELD